MDHFRRQRSSAEYYPLHDMHTADAQSTPPKTALNSAGRSISSDYQGPRADEKHVDYSHSNRTGFWSILGRWSSDLFACLLACGAFLSIVIILWTQHARPLPRWPFGISVNALVSVFASLLKAAMIYPVASAISQLKWSWFRESRPLMDIVRFDDASRGLLGALMLLKRVPGTHIVSLGALITILAIASDPFVQQVVHYRPCPYQDVNVTSFMARSNNYTSSGVRTSAQGQTLELPMQAAIYKGVYDSFNPITATCTTGNCTFQDYRTVGMCGGCTNISDRLRYVNNGTKSASSEYWVTPDKQNLNNSSPIAMTMSTTDWIYSNISTLVQTEVLSFTSSTDYNDVGDFSGFIFSPNSVMALDCWLNPCVRTYSAGVQEGQTSEQLLSTAQMSAPKDNPFKPWTAHPMPCLMNGSYHDVSEFKEQTTKNKNLVHDLLPNNQTAYLPDECTFQYGTPLGLQQYLVTFLAGYVEKAPELDMSDPEWMGQLFNDGSATLDTVNDTWAALADSLTVQMRQAGDAINSAPAEGNTWHTETCIIVEWVWLSYPAALLVGTILFFFAAVIHSTSHSSQPVWKASPLALLFHGFDETAQDNVRRIHHTKEMEQIAKVMNVRLRDGNRGLRFHGE